MNIPKEKILEYIDALSSELFSKELVGLNKLQVATLRTNVVGKCFNCTDDTDKIILRQVATQLNEIRRKFK